MLLSALNGFSDWLFNKYGKGYEATKINDIAEEAGKIRP